AYQGGVAVEAELSQIETLVGDLETLAVSGSSMAAVTLGGCIIDVTPQRRASAPVVRIFREPGERLPALVLNAGESGDWDERFRVQAAPTLAGAITIAALGAEGWARLKRDFPQLEDALLLARAAATLPSVWQDGQLAAVPFLARWVPQLSGA